MARTRRMTRSRTACLRGRSDFGNFAGGRLLGKLVLTIVRNKCYHQIRRKNRPTGILATDRRKKSNSEGRRFMIPKRAVRSADSQLPQVRGSGRIAL